MKRLVLFASGSGSNVENIARYFKSHENVEVTAVLTNKRDAGVIDRCNRLGIAVFSFNKVAFNGSDRVLQILKCLQPDLIVLAGFLMKIPKEIVSEFPDKIINIHPALLPKYGGKGMYGMNVHEAVIAKREMESGISIHYVNEEYDKGAMIFQAKVAVLPSDGAEDLANRIHQLEYEHFPRVIEQLLESLDG